MNNKLEQLLQNKKLVYIIWAVLLVFVLSFNIFLNTKKENERKQDAINKTQVQNKLNELEWTNLNTSISEIQSEDVFFVHSIDNIWDLKVNLESYKWWQTKIYSIIDMKLKENYFKWMSKQCYDLILWSRVKEILSDWEVKLEQLDKATWVALIRVNWKYLFKTLEEEWYISSNEWWNENPYVKLCKI